MSIGIIVYSKTGNTLSVATQLKDKLLANHFAVNLEEIIISGDPDKGMGHFVLEQVPAFKKYDILVLAAPVQAFALNPVMISYLNQFVSFENKKIACFVTQFFPYPWLGGNHAISQFKKIINNHQGQVIVTGVVNWSNKRREQMIESLVNRIFEAITRN